MGTVCELGVKRFQSGPKVMFIAPSAYRIGGVQTWLDYILPGLAARGWQTVLGLVAGEHHDANAYLRAHPFDEVIVIQSGTGTRRSRIRNLAESIESQSPNLVAVVNIVDAYSAAARVRFECNPDLKIIGTLHGLQPDFLQDFARYRNHLDAVVCTNRLASAMVVRWSGLDPDRVFYSPYGIEAPTVGASAMTDGEMPLRLAYVGRLEAVQKRVYDVVKILRQGLASGLDLTLTAAGEGPDNESFMAAVSHAGLAGRVWHLGALDPSSVRARVYADCDVLLLTSAWETGPIVAWEAMAHGLALATSDYLGRKCEGCLIDDVNCLVFPVGDIVAAVEGLVKLQDALTRQRIAAAGRQLALHSYLRAGSVSAWSECFRQVAALPRLPRCRLEPMSDSPGRLDLFLGGEAAEFVRRLLGRRFKHTEPSGEWPHSYGDRRPDDPEFWGTARELDVPPAAET